MNGLKRLGALTAATLLTLPACYTPELVLERYYECSNTEPCFLSIEEGWEGSMEVGPEVCRADYEGDEAFIGISVCVSCDAFKGTGCPCDGLTDLSCEDGSRCSALTGLCSDRPEDLIDDIPFAP